MQTLQFQIGGMMCAACQNHVATALQSATGVESATVDLESKSALVRGQNLDVAQLVEAVEAEGYTAKATTGEAI